MNKGLTIGVVLFILAIAAFQLFQPSAKTEKQATTPTATQLGGQAQEAMEETKKLTKPELTIDQSKEYIATLDTTEGEIKIKLNADTTPITANNFVYLANNNFYDNTIFHRVISGFMIQGGDSEGTGSGGPGYRFDDEEGGLRPEYKRGVVAMANAGPNTNGSQFFIMHKDFDLAPLYVIFGEVIEGMDVVDSIATAETTVGSDGNLSRPVEPVIVQSVTIQEN